MPMSYHLLYLRGKIHEFKCEFEEARQCFENSLGIYLWMNTICDCVY